MLNFFVTISYIIFIYYFTEKEGYFPSFWDRSDVAFAIIHGFVSINVLAGLITAPLNKKPLLRRIVGVLFLLAILLLYFYKHDRKFSIDVNLLISNLSIAFKLESLIVILSIFTLNKIVMLMTIVLSYIVLDWYREKRRFLFYNWTSRIGHRQKTVFFASGLLLFFISASFSMPTFDESSYLVRNTYLHFVDDFRTGDSTSSITVNDKILSTDNSPSMEFERYEKKPNIFILMIESFSGTFVDYLGPDQSPIMENYQALIQEGFYVDNYYGNSIQTARGQYAALFSQIPSYMEKVFAGYEDNSIQSFPEVLRGKGYSTAFIKAYKDINFDNSGNFLKKHGFDHAFSLYDFLSDSEKENIWGWGPEDTVFYNHIPDFIDSIEDSDKTEKPFFMVLHTVMNHMYFDRIPAELRRLYPEPKNRFENYANSLKLVDEQLTVFKETLVDMGMWDDSIIIITGDHGFPFGEHSLLHNETSYYEEAFRTPFLMIAENHLKPTREKKSRQSHLDMGPTLLDLLGFVDLDNTFVGRSMLRQNDADAPVYCIQPYSGGYLVSIRGDIKYLYHRTSNKGFYYDLARDPDEKNPQKEESLPEELLSQFKSDISYIMERQSALDRDQLWPN